jgi:hypothetical protein
MLIFCVNECIIGAYNVGEFMKRKPFVLTIILALLFSVVTSLSFIQFGKANWLLPPQVPPVSPTLVIDSPVHNETKNTSNVDLNCTVYAAGWNKYYSGDFLRIGYSLDEKPYVWLFANNVTPNIDDNGLATFHFSMKLTGLTDGTHSLTASAQHFGKYSPAPYKLETFIVRGYSPEIFFSIETHTIPEFPSLAPLLILSVVFVSVMFFHKQKLNKGRTM